MVEDGYRSMQRDVLQALNPLSNRVTFIAIVPGAYPSESKMWLKTLKMLIHFTTRHRYIAISQKWLKINGYVQRGV